MNFTRFLSEGEGCIFDVGSLSEQLEQLTDKRKAKGKRYSLALVLLLTVLAKMGGEDKPTGMAEWAHHRCQALVELLGLQRATMPCHNTYRRVMQRAVDVAEMERVVGHYLGQLVAGGGSDLVVMDGKTLRGTIPTGKSQGVHLLVAYIPEQGVVLMQVAVDGKENEIVAAPRLLRAIDLRGKVVRGAAMHTQRAVSVQILEAGGDYIWPVAENQPTLLADIQEVFDPAPTAPGWNQAPRDWRTAETVNGGHGRVEKRTLTASCFLNDYCDWPGLAQVFKLHRWAHIRTTGELRSETVFGITSLSPEEAPPELLLALMRDYWGVENGLHYRRDVTLKEDATRMKHPTQAQVMALINNLVIALSKYHGFNNLPAARRFFNAQLAYTLHLLLSPPPKM